MKTGKRETRTLEEIVSNMSEVIRELLPDFDESPDLFGIDFDFA